MTSSFQRKVKSRVEPIPGCFPSLYTHHLLTSTGVPDLDLLIGGGLPVGTLLLVEEDFAGSYSKLLLKYFLAEGVYHRHSLHVAGLIQDPTSIVQNLPSAEEKSDEDSDSKHKKSNEDELKIAWRYKNKSFDTSDKNKSKHSFNLQKSVEKSVLEECDIVTCDLEDCDSDSPKSIQLLHKLHQHCQSRGFFIEPPSQSEKKNILRIGVQSLGDILWGETPTQILTFLLALKALLRNCYGVALVTIPPVLLENEDIRDRLESCGDFVVNLKSFDAEETVNPTYKDYHGIISINRISSLGVLSPPLHLIQDDNELVFKSRRNRFLIEKFHLPPDLSEVVSRDQKDPKLKKNIEF